MISKILVTAVDYMWGPCLLTIIGGGIYLLIVSRLKTIKGFFQGLRLVFGRFHHPNDAHALGQISHFKALCNALSSTIGLGNIAGVAIAISQGGPGAIFWMWVAAIFGMNTKFFECTLASMFRGRDYCGEIQGGPMYYILALPKRFHPLSWIFACCGLFGTLAFFNANQLASYTHQYYKFPLLVTALATCALIVYILLGGLYRLSHFTSKLVPVMCLIYVLSCLVILVLNSDQIPLALTSIFKEAFGVKAVWGGSLGLTASKIVQIGFKRACFSNEAGVGTAPMAHGNAKTSEPIAEGLVAMLGPFFDTLIVCTLTALTILTTVRQEDIYNLSGALITAKAFENGLPFIGHHVLGVSIILFSFTTIVGTANYNQKCWNFLFKGRFFLGHKSFIAFFTSSILVGMLSSMDDVINFLDICFALMTLPNMIATILLAPKVSCAMNDYFKRFHIDKTF